MIEVQKEHWKTVCEVLKGCMEGAWQLAVPLEVQLRVGPSWGTLTPYPPV